MAYSAKYSISICSVSFPHLRKGAMRDWRKIMEDFGLYQVNSHEKTSYLYQYPSGSYIEFFSVDNALKVRGPGRDILFINEANIIHQDTFRQLLLRTKKAVFIDFNPADEFHWIYDDVLTRPDCYFIQSTYRDNPFLHPSQRQEIESYKDQDENFWRVYGLGERGHSSNIIYNKWEVYDREINFEHVYGLDFGYNHPSALIKVSRDSAMKQNDIYWEEKIYQSFLTTSDLITMVKPIVGKKKVLCDSARPEIIEELVRGGINAVSANKNVKEGIDFVKSHRIFVHRNSFNLQKELRSYKWKSDAQGRIMDEPVKLFDDGCDAGRYGTIDFKQNHLVYIPQIYSRHAERPNKF